jgi:hypothetical protein
MIKVFEKNVPIKMTSKWLSRWGIHNVVVENISFPSFEGASNVQPFELNLLSDEPIYLEIK